MILKQPSGYTFSQLSALGKVKVSHNAISRIGRMFSLYFGEVELQDDVWGLKCLSDVENIKLHQARDRRVKTTTVSGISIRNFV